MICNIVKQIKMFQNKHIEVEIMFCMYFTIGIIFQIFFQIHYAMFSNTYSNSYLFDNIIQNLIENLNFSLLRLMNNCIVCDDNTNQYYVYTVCKHFICTVCAFQIADFTLQTIKCCEQDTKLEQQSMSVIIKSRRYKPINFQLQNRQENNQCDKQNTKINSSPAQNSPSKKISPQKPILRTPSSNQPNQISSMIVQTQKSNLEKILLEEIQRIRKQFDQQHQILRAKEQQTIQKLIQAYNEETKDIILAQQSKSRHIDFQKDQLKRTFQQISQNLPKNSNPSIQSSRKPQEPPINTPQKYFDDEIPDNSWVKTCKNQHQFDYIIKRLQLNQQKMNQKLRKHANSHCIQ